MDYNIPTGGYSREEKSVFLEFQLFCYRYKKLIKISYVGLYKIYDWPKFEGHNSLNKTAMPLGSSKLKWAWRTQFLSHTLQILGKVIFFEDLQMILLSLLVNHYCKSFKKCTQAIRPGVEESLPYISPCPISWSKSCSYLLI